MSDNLRVIFSPHQKSGVTTGAIMGTVLLALLPSVAAATYLWGIRALALVAVCAAAAVAGEWAYQKILRRPSAVGDLSAVVTGVLLACNLPANFPLWMAALGSLFAIVVVKQLFGGIGENFANPAITARVFLLISFGSAMTSFPQVFSVDAVASATPLADFAAGRTGILPSYTDLFLGLRPGSLGETCIAAILLGFALLVATRVIQPTIPVCFVGTVYLFSMVLGHDPLFQILSGGLMFGAVFMATDYTTSPTTTWGKVIFGVGCGFLTAVIRAYGSYPEGVSFAILIMNLLVPYIDKATRRRPFGSLGKEASA